MAADVMATKMEAAEFMAMEMEAAKFMSAKIKTRAVKVMESTATKLTAPAGNATEKMTV